MEALNGGEQLLQFRQVKIISVVGLHGVLFGIEQILGAIVQSCLLGPFAEDTLTVIAHRGTDQQRVRLAVQDRECLGDDRCLVVHRQVQRHFRFAIFGEVARDRTAGCGGDDRIRELPFVRDGVVVRVIDVSYEGVVLVDVEHAVHAGEGRDGVVHRDVCGLGEGFFLVYLEGHDVVTRFLIHM